MTRKQRVVLGLSLAAVVLTTSALYGVFGFSSVCSRCGVIRDTTEWQIPRTGITLFRHSSEHASAVSIVLNKGGLVAAHEHQWLFCAGGGNGVTCAIGQGRHIRPSVESDGVAVVIAASQRFGELDFRDRLLRALFNPKTSAAVRLLGSSVPRNGFPDGPSFHAWMLQEKETFDETVAMYQKK